MNDGTDRVSRLPLAQRMTVVDMLIDGKRHGEVREALRGMGCAEADIPSDFSLNNYKKTDECERMYVDRVKLFRAQRDGALMEGRLDGESTATLVEIAETLRGTHRNGNLPITEMLAVFRAMVDYKRLQIAAAREARMWGNQPAAMPRPLRAMAAPPEGDLPEAANMQRFFAPQHEVDEETVAARTKEAVATAEETAARAEEAALDAELDAAVGDLATARADLRASSVVAATAVGLAAPAPARSETERSVAICSEIERSAGGAPTLPPSGAAASATAATPATDWSRGLSWAASQALAEGRCISTPRVLPAPAAPAAQPVSASTREADIAARREATADAYRAASDRVCADWWGPPEEDDLADAEDWDANWKEPGIDLDAREAATGGVPGRVPSPAPGVHHRLGRPSAAPPGRVATG